MKKTIITTLAIVLLSSLSRADQARYETITLTAPTTLANGIYFQNATNSIQIAEGEVAELICVEGTVASRAFVTKNNVRLNARPTGSSSSTSVGTTVAGPAAFELNVYYPSTGPYLITQAPPEGLMTVKITPLSYSPQKSVTVAPGMGNVQIELESSTNLLTWAASTNGVYNDDLRFFRVKLTKLNP